MGKNVIGYLLVCTAALLPITPSPSKAAGEVVVIPLESGSTNSGGVRTVVSAGQVWMDRNLGAERVATKSNDARAYGALYQWGRPGDGHEYRESPETSTLSISDVPGHGYFIMVGASPHDWMAMPNNNLWQSESGPNNPCPAGFRLPTISEWHLERDSWSSNDSAGAFGSPLKLTAAGVRDQDDGRLEVVGQNGYYWSSTISGTGARASDFNISGGATNSRYRGSGFSVRCIKD